MYLKKDVDTYNCVNKIEKAHEDEIRCLQILVNGLLASGSADYSIKFWNIQTKECLVNIEYAHEDSVLCFQMLPNGLLASGSSDRSIKVNLGFLFFM